MLFFGDFNRFRQSVVPKGTMRWERLIKFLETVQIVVREEALLCELLKKIISNLWEASSQQFEVTSVDGFR